MPGHVVDADRLVTELEELRTRNAELAAGLAAREAVEREVGERLQQRAAELAVVNSVQEALAAQLDMQGVIDVVGDTIREIFDAQVIYIALYDRQSQMISFPYLREGGQRFVVEPDPLGEGLTSLVIRSRRPLVRGTSQQLMELGAILSNEPTGSYLGVPLIAGGETIGVVSVQSFQEHAFAEWDVHLLTTLAASMGVALENARLFAETRRVLAETDRRAAELAVINSVQHALASQLDMHAIVEVVGTKIHEIVGAEGTFIALVDHGQGTITFPYYVANNGQRIDKEPTKLGEGFTSHVIATKQTLTIAEGGREAARRGLLAATAPGEDDSAPARSMSATVASVTATSPRVRATHASPLPPSLPARPSTLDPRLATRSAGSGGTSPPPRGRRRRT